MKKLILLLLFIPLVSFGQDNEKKFEGVIKENRFKNFIRTAYYPTSPFINPFDTIVVIGKNITTGNPIKLIVDNTSDTAFKMDFSLNLKDFYAPELSYVKNAVEKAYGGKDLSKEEKSSLSNLIIKNINNRDLFYIDFDIRSIISSNIPNSLNKKIRNHRLDKRFGYLRYDFRRAISGSSKLHYIKIKFDEPFIFSYSLKTSSGESETVYISRKHKNPFPDYIYKIETDQFYNFYNVSLDEFFNNN